MNQTGKENTPALSESQVQDLMGHLKKYENPQDIVRPYFDSKGHLTVGPGFKVETAEELASLNLTITDSEGNTVPPEEAFETFKKHAPKTPEEMNRSAEEYKIIGGLNGAVSEETVNRRLREEITQRAAKARDVLGEDDWKKLHPGAQHAIVDAAYAAGGVEGWDGLKTAVENYQPGSEEKLKDVLKETTWVIDPLKMNRPTDRQVATFTKALGDGKKAKAFHNELTADDEKKAAENRKAAEEKAARQKAEKKPAEEAVSPKNLSGENSGDEAGGAADKKSPDDDGVRNMLRRVEDDEPSFPRTKGAEKLLFKSPGQLTQDEAGVLGRIYADMNPSDPLRAMFARQRTRFFDHTYGTGPQPVDATGRPIDTGPRRPVPKQTTPAKDPDGEPLYRTVLGAAHDIAKAAQGGGLSATVKAVQSGLNAFNRITRAGEDKKGGGFKIPERLKTDGVFGPKTHWALKARAAQSGAGGLRNTLAAGRVSAAAESVRRRENKTPALDKPEITALQSALNTFKPPEKAALKEDGVFGPKTASAFAETADKKDPDDLAERFGRAIGARGRAPHVLTRAGRVAGFLN